METYTFIQDLVNRIISNIELLIDELDIYVYKLVGIVVLIHVAYKTIWMILDPNKGIDPFILVRTCLLLVCIYLYSPLVEFFLIKPMDLLANAIEKGILNLTGLDIVGFNAEFNSSMQAQDDRLYDALQIHPLLELFHILVFFIGSAVAVYMLLKQTLTIGFYYLAGYFSILFSFIPGNEKSFQTWALTFLGILLWKPMIMLIKYLILLTQVSTTTFNEFWLVIAIQISAIFLILKVPSFCELLISSGSALATPYAGGFIGAIRRLARAKSGL